MEVRRSSGCRGGKHAASGDTGTTSLLRPADPQQSGAALGSPGHAHHAGARTYRSTDATIFVAVEGSGSSRIGDAHFAWGKHDVFVVPSWCPVSHEAGPESVLFSFSDRPVQQALGLWREDRADIG